VAGDSGETWAGENCIMTGFIICTVIKYYFGDQIKEDEMAGALSRVRENKNAYKV
jgi:hypothetical protein